MRETFCHGVGGVLSADIAVPEHDRELNFYSKVLTTGVAPLWRDDLMNNCGTPIIGLGQRVPEYESLPLQWMPHFQVADVATSAARAVEVGGAELMHGKDDDGHSQWAVITDPAGAAFGLIPVVPVESNTAENSERIGCISWLTLAVPDAAVIRDFYQQVVGWDAKAIDLEDDDGQFVNFQMLRDNGAAAAEICHNRLDLKDIPPTWLISLPVDDFTESLSQVHHNGGEVIVSNLEANYAIIRDPVGVYITLQAG